MSNYRKDMSMCILEAMILKVKFGGSTVIFYILIVLFLDDFWILRNIGCKIILVPKMYLYEEHKNLLRNKEEEKKLKF